MTRPFRDRWHTGPPGETGRHTGPPGNGAMLPRASAPRVDSWSSNRAPPRTRDAAAVHLLMRPRARGLRPAPAAPESVLDMVWRPGPRPAGAAGTARPAMTTA